MKILLATDGSDYSKAAVEEIAQRIFPTGTKVLIVSAFQNASLITSASSLEGGLTGGFEETVAVIRKLAENAVQQAAELLKKKNPALSISTKAINGTPKHTILKEAEKMGADLIVVGSHGRGAIGRFLLGSVSQAIALHADCSVLIVRKRRTKRKQARNKHKK